MISLDLQIPVTKKDAVGVTDISLFRQGWTRIHEAFAGAWQRNITYTTENVLIHAAVYRCITLIASDIAKVRVRMVEQDRHGIWAEIENPAFSPVLRKPNHYQTRIQFVFQWVVSKLIAGNTYVLKYRDNRGGTNRGNVVQMYVLDPNRVRVKVSPDGSIFYQLSSDNLSGAENVSVPASEIIHDVLNPLYHPLCGVTPITACGLSAIQGIRAQENSARFFGNDSRPSGTLTGPSTIPDDVAARLGREWQDNFSGENYGKVAVLGNGLKYEAMTVNAHDSQLLEQLKWTSENVCTAFGVPGYMVGVGSPPTYNNIEALSAQYYSQCLQVLIESIELLLDEGLDTGRTLGTEFDLDDLLRMDTMTRVNAAKESMNSGVSPNEVRHRFHNLPPVEGGETPYLQEQNWPLKLLAARELPARQPTEPKPLPPSASDVKRLRARIEQKCLPVNS